MKKLLSVLVLLLAVVFATAQTPKINYQAVIRDSHNRLVANTTIQVDVTVSYSGGTYSETLSGTTNANGLLSLEIGGGSNFNLIDWSTATIQTTAHLPGNETLQDVVNVTAVPFALHAEYADSVNLNVIANYLNSHDIPSGTGMNVQSDWNQTDTQADDYIKNKPTLATVATSGSYNDLSNKPTNLVNTDALLAVFDSLTRRMNILHDSLLAMTQNMPKMGQEYFMATAGQTQFVLENKPNTNCIYRMYINGEMVSVNGDNILTVDGNDVTGKTMNYSPSANDERYLEEGEKVTIVYWYLPTPSAIPFEVIPGEQ